MDPTVQRTSSSRVDLLDTSGRLIGSITRPVAQDVLGPGREKVYLARRTARPEALLDRRSQAA
jgi:hypothetical protein